MKVTIYTDGACHGNPGNGGWGAILLYQHPTHGTHRREICGNAENTTNQRMELLAAIRGIEALKTACDVEIITDSQYLCDNFSRYPIWRDHQWRLSSGKPAMNVDLWETLDRVIAEKNATVSFTKVRGHKGVKENEAADKLAQGAVLQLEIQAYNAMP